MEQQPAIWVEMHDNSGFAPANLRQAFKPLQQGRLSLRLMTARDHPIGIGVYPGTVSAAAPTDRVIDIKTDDTGRVRLGSRARRLETPLVIQPDVVTRLWVSWRPAASGTFDVRLGTADAEGAEKELAQFMAPDPAPITTLRMTIDIPAVAGTSA